MLCDNCIYEIDTSIEISGCSNEKSVVHEFIFFLGVLSRDKITTTFLKDAVLQITTLCKCKEYQSRFSAIS